MRLFIGSKMTLYHYEVQSGRRTLIYVIVFASFGLLMRTLRSLRKERGILMRIRIRIFAETLGGACNGLVKYLRALINYLNYEFMQS